MNILDLNKSQKKIETFIEDGKSKIHILTDFDKTLTKGRLSKNTSVIAKIRESAHVPELMKEGLYKNFNRFHPFENDPDLSNAAKSKYMVEWYKATDQVFMSHKLSKQMLADVVEHSDLDFRDDIQDLFAICKEHKIPIVIISAGLGDLIQLYLEKYNMLSPNVHIVSNFFIYNEQGDVIDRTLPVIHPMNKYESLINESKFFSKIKDRTNVIQMGDHVGDYQMVSGFDYKTLLSIAYLHIDCPKVKQQFAENFDIIYEHEADFTEVINILKKAK